MRQTKERQDKLGRSAKSGRKFDPTAVIPEPRRLSDPMLLSGERGEPLVRVATAGTEP